MHVDFDTDGVLRHPDFHDGRLEQVGVTPDSTLNLALRTIDGAPFRVSVPQVLRVKADNFREGNVVFEVGAYSLRDCPRELLVMLEAMQPLTAADYDGVKTVVYVVSSYGCDLIALGSAPIAAIELRGRLIGRLTCEDVRAFT